LEGEAGEGRIGFSIGLTGQSKDSAGTLENRVCPADVPHND
jgi:hypothetical protein